MQMTAVAFLIGRGLLAALFILAGLSKIVGPKPFLAHMKQEGVPAFLFPFVVVLEIGCGAALLAGFHAMIAAAILSAFCIATAIVFHRHFADRAERTQFAKDVALAGALLVLAVS